MLIVISKRLAYGRFFSLFAIASYIWRVFYNEGESAL